MTKQSDDETVRSRRAFLKGAGVAGVAGLGAAFSAVTKDEAEANADKPDTAGSYRETDHVNAYYEAAKF